MRTELPQERIDRITLTIVRGLWTATYSGPCSARLIELMGSSSVPTAFLAETPATVVSARISALNPDWEVVVVS